VKDAGRERLRDKRTGVRQGAEMGIEVRAPIVLSWIKMLLVLGCHGTQPLVTKSHGISNIKSPTSAAFRYR